MRVVLETGGEQDELLVEENGLDLRAEKAERSGVSIVRRMSKRGCVGAPRVRVLAGGQTATADARPPSRRYVC